MPLTMAGKRREPLNIRPPTTPTTTTTTTRPTRRTSRTPCKWYDPPIPPNDAVDDGADDDDVYDSDVEYEDKDINMSSSSSSGNACE